MFTDTAHLSWYIILHYFVELNVSVEILMKTGPKSGSPMSYLNL